MAVNPSNLDKHLGEPPSPNTPQLHYSKAVAPQRNRLDPAASDWPPPQDVLPSGCWLEGIKDRQAELVIDTQRCSG